MTIPEIAQDAVGQLILVGDTVACARTTSTTRIEWLVGKIVKINKSGVTVEDIYGKRHVAQFQRIIAIWDLKK